MKRRWLASLEDVGGVVAMLVLLVALENIVIAVAYRAEFTASWEMAQARNHLSPIAIATLVPLAIAAVVVGRLVAARRANEVAALAAAAGLAVGLGVTTGRHFASWAARAPFVLVLAALAGGAAFVATRKLPEGDRRSAVRLAATGAVVAVLAWLADARVLPRLYPAFHLGLAAITVLAWSATWLAVRGSAIGRMLARLALALAAFCIAWTPRAARTVSGSDNLRRVLVEHAPLLGRAVRVAATLAPPPPLDEDASSEAMVTAATNPSSARSLDWTGHDIVLVTIDALRADHVSAYGYARKTTPNIDALAARGVRFEHAYCPTPHTSYSVASMMTGKYVRPLLAMGASDDAETWPLYLRRYGYRTAAFYPPAVFFIDEHKFKTMQSTGLGFEYRKEEFATPELRRAQIERYLTVAPRDKPLFLWVHLFEPHEPYEMHPEHPFSGDETTDAYDSEIATADALVGDVERLVNARRPGAVFVVSADHGEELGDHGGRYHGTTVYEEQVRVPLVVVAPNLAPAKVDVPVQTIDLLPTVLASLDIPRPARLRGRDLGPLLTGKAKPDDEGLAFSETDEQTLVARGKDRLVCARKIGACTLYDVAVDPHEKTPVSSAPARVAELRKLTAAIERENGKLEASGMPDALRRGLQGDRDAAEDVAPLFDDARADIRRGAARCAFRLKAPEMTPQLRRALVHDEDPEVRAWSAIALVRMGDPLGVEGPRDAGGGAAGTLTLDVLSGDKDPALRTAAALALAERGDTRGERLLEERWDKAFVPGAPSPGEVDEARDLLRAFVMTKARAAVPLLVRSLDDVRLRPFVVETLGALGDARAKEPLLAAFRAERYVHMRAPEAKALASLGAGQGTTREAFREALARFAGVPEPTLEVLSVARDAGVLAPATGGVALPSARSLPETALRVAGEGPARLLVLLDAPEEDVTATVDGVPVTLAPPASGVRTAELPVVSAQVKLAVAHDKGVLAAWIVRRAPEIPPPPPRAWDAGASPDDVP